MRSSLDRLRSRFKMAEERINELEDRLLEIIQSEKKRLKKMGENLRDLWDNTKHINMCNSKQSKKKRDKKKIFQQIIWAPGGSAG